MLMGWSWLFAQYHPLPVLKGPYMGKTNNAHGSLQVWYQIFSCSVWERKMTFRRWLTPTVTDNGKCISLSPKEGRVQSPLRLGVFLRLSQL